MSMSSTREGSAGAREGPDKNRLPRPTFQTWVALQPLWLLAGMLFPHHGWITVYASVPFGIALARAARWLRLSRTPTLFSLLVATAGYLLVVRFGLGQVAALALADAPHKLAVSLAMIAGYLTLELRAWAIELAREFGKRFEKALARRIAKHLERDLP